MLTIAFHSIHFQHLLHSAFGSTLFIYTSLTAEPIFTRVILKHKNVSFSMPRERTVWVQFLSAYFWALFLRSEAKMFQMIEKTFAHKKLREKRENAFLNVEFFVRLFFWSSGMHADRLFKINISKFYWKSAFHSKVIFYFKKEKYSVINSSFYFPPFAIFIWFAAFRIVNFNISFVFSSSFSLHSALFVG